MKREIAALLLVALLVGLTGCHGAQTTAGTTGTTTTTATTTGSTATGSTTQPDVEPEVLYYQADYAAGYVMAGSVEAYAASGEPISVTYDDAYKGTPGFDYSTPDVFSFVEAISSDVGLCWSPQNWQTAEDGHILEYTTTPLYSFVLNSDLSGFTIACEMAAAPPADVTQEFAGSFGILPGETGKAWRIALHEEAYWSNGVQIDADTYLYSYQQLLDRRMENGRGAELCQGDFAIAGAADYYAGSGSWEDVGILKTGQYEIVLITEQPVSQPEFYVPYYLQSTYLVYPPLWEACKQYRDADGNALPADGETVETVTTTYCTSLETSVSYGPYTVVEHKNGEYLMLERNFTWYGYADGKHLGQYQADDIYCLVISDYTTAMALYEAGLLDMVTLQAVDVERFAESGLLRYVPESYTTKLTFNTDTASLAARGNGVLANVYFRKAFSLAIDRSRFAGGAGLGLVNDAYFSDVAASVAYRDTAEAQNILLWLYDFDGASESLTGMDLQWAQALMARAFDECTADGSYDGVSPITLQLSVYREDAANAQLLACLQDAMNSACEGTGFAGKVTVALVVDENCYAAMAMGHTDMILTTWGGNVCDPYDLLYRCYCSDERLEFGFDPSAVTVEMEINGQLYCATLLQWALWCAGEDSGVTALAPFGEYSPESRAAIFAQLEFAYLSQYATTPLYSRTSIRLLSEKGDFAVKNYRNLVGFGGIRYYTFAYTDRQWAQRFA